MSLNPPGAPRVLGSIGDQWGNAEGFLNEEAYPDVPLDFWERDDLDLEEISRYCPVIDVGGRAEHVVRLMREKPPAFVSFEARDLEFDVQPPSHGLEVAEFYEAVRSFCDELGPGCAESLVSSDEDTVKKSAVLSRARDILEPLLAPEAWKVTPNPGFYRVLKNGIVSPYISLVNDFFSKRRDERGINVLVIGSWSGADIQRVAIARGSTANLVVDTYDPFANQVWDAEFRTIVQEKYGAPVGGSHIMVPPHKLLSELCGRKYDLVLAANSLHQFMRDVGEFNAILRAISDSLAPGAQVIGMFPHVDGFRTLESAPHVSLLSVEGGKDQTVCPFGRFTVLVANQVIDDPQLDPAWFMASCARLGLVAEVMAASNVSAKTAVVKALPYGPETRGYLYFTLAAEDQLSVSAFAVDSITPVASRPVDPQELPPTEIHVFGRDILAPRDVGRPVNFMDSLFMKNCEYYVAEKLDGVGSVLGVYPNASGQAILVLRHGSPRDARFKFYEVPRYDGPPIVLDGEFMIGSCGWTFDVFGLIRYGTLRDPPWYLGMSIAHRWLESMHARGLFANLGMKRWVRATADNVSSVWERCSEGIVFKYACAPPARILNNHEIGNAKYVKRIPTFDLKVRVLPDGRFEPPIAGLPSHFDVSAVVECSKDTSGVYHYVRYRRDKKYPNDPRVLAEKEKSSKFSDVIRWISEREDIAPITVVLDQGGEWANFVTKGDAGVDEQFRMTLAASGVRPIHVLVRGQRARDTEAWVYTMRHRYFRQAIQGRFDPLLKNHAPN